MCSKTLSGSMSCTCCKLFYHEQFATPWYRMRGQTQSRQILVKINIKRYISKSHKCVICILTLITVGASPSHHTLAWVRVDSVNACRAILARAIGTFIDIYKHKYEMFAEFAKEMRLVRVKYAQIIAQK